MKQAILLAWIIILNDDSCTLSNLESLSLAIENVEGVKVGINTQDLERRANDKILVFLKHIGVKPEAFNFYTHSTFDSGGRAVVRVEWFMNIFGAAVSSNDSRKKALNTLAFIALCCESRNLGMRRADEIYNHQ